MEDDGDILENRERDWEGVVVVESVGFASPIFWGLWLTWTVFLCCSVVVVDGEGESVVDGAD